MILLFLTVMVLRERLRETMKMNGERTTMTLRINTFFCQTESKLYQEIKDARPLEIHYWKKVLFNHAKETGHHIIITEDLQPGTKDKSQL